MTTADYYHFGMSSIGRSAGRSSVAAAAYRTGSSIECEREGVTHDYSRKRGVLASFTLAPEGAPAWATDAAQLWNAVEKRENRKNSQLAKEITLALPASLSPEEREGIARDLGMEIVERYGLAVTVALHAPGHEGDLRNYHAHFMLTTRRLGPGGWGGKAEELDNKPGRPSAEVAELRELAADIINEALEDAGSDERVDHRSFRERGIDKEPTRHVGPAAAAMERRAGRQGGFGSDRAETNRKIIEQRIAEQELYLRALTRAYDPDSAPAELSLETERELERRFGGEWRTANRGEGIDDPEAKVEASMADAIANLQRTGTTTGEAPASLFQRMRGRFMELLRDESGEAKLDSDGMTWAERVTAERAAEAWREAVETVGRWFRTGPEEPDQFQQDLKTHLAAGPQQGGDFPVSGDDGGGGGEAGDLPRLSGDEGTGTAGRDDPPRGEPEEGGAGSAPVSGLSGAAETGASAAADAPRAEPQEEGPGPAGPSAIAIEEELSAGFSEIGDAYQQAVWNGPDWMNHIIEEELPGAADEPSTDPPAPEPEPDNGPDMG